LAYETNRDHLDVRTNELITFNTVISSFDYTVDSIGRRSGVAQSGSAVTVPGQTITWGYNDRDEVISADHSADNAQDRAYDFDGIGNRLTATDDTGVTSYTSNPLNQYTAVGTVNPVHDLDGNATAAPLPADTSANATLTWDGENRLVQITRTDGVVVDYTYDARGRRVRKTVANGEDRWFVYDGWNLVAEYNASSGAGSSALSPATTYTWGQDVSGTMQGAGGVGGLLAVRSGGQDYFPLYDGNGNVTEYLDSAGVMVAHYEYDAFGKVAAISGSQAGDFAFQFSTKYADGESGLSYYGYRYYDAQTGRWISRDPIEERGGWNLYGFVGNNAVNATDFLGKWPKKIPKPNPFAIGSAAICQAAVAVIQRCAKKYECKENCNPCCSGAAAIAAQIVASLANSLNPIGAISCSHRLANAVNQCETDCEAKPSVEPPDCCKEPKGINDGEPYEMYPGAEILPP
ncbi:MAG: RHS repeat domain-containing protein, partial [Verrucomicrobiales bacterium]